MAVRTIFVPVAPPRLGVKEVEIDFSWFPGMAISQAQKSINSLHQRAAEKGYARILEISSKSPVELGVALSAFNLKIRTKKHAWVFTVESAFQGSKVFERGGPYIDLLCATSKEAKTDIRLKESGNLIGFHFYGKDFPLLPRTFFYDWLYLNALMQNEELAEQIAEYDGFTDIVFNPARSINCQAYSAALYVSLSKSGLLKDALSSPDAFHDILKSSYLDRKPTHAVQGSLT